MGMDAFPGSLGATIPNSRSSVTPQGLWLNADWLDRYASESARLKGLADGHEADAWNAFR